jgi:copper transport protein
LLLVLLAGAALIAAPAAAGHAYLVRSVPAAGGVSERAPAELRLVFDEGVTAVEVTVTKEGGGTATAGKAFVPHGRPDEIHVPLRGGLEKGIYDVHWREVDEDDGHVLSGSFSFGVGKGVRPPLNATTSGSEFKPGTSVARFFLLAGILVGAGTAIFRRTVARGTQGRWAAVVGGALAVAACGALAELLLQPEPLATRFGKVTLAGLVVAAAGAALTVFSRREAELAALTLIALPTLQGHAFAHGTPHALSIPSDLVHVAAAAAWIGGVVSLALVVPRPSVLRLTRRFAPVAAGAIAALALTGVLRAVGELDHASQVWTTSYGRTLIVKTALLAVPIALALVHRGVPTLRGLGAELPVLVSLVAAVAVLTGLRPGIDFARTVVSVPNGPALLTVGAEAGDLAIGLRLTQDSGRLAARATVLGQEGPVRDARVTLGVAGAKVEARACGAGCYTAATGDPQRLSALSVEVERPGRSPVTATFRVPAVWPPKPGTTIVRRAALTFDALQTLTILSRLASDESNATTTIWKLQAPDRLSYRERGSGSAAVIVGNRRWDRTRDGGRWVESPQQPVDQPSAPWPGPIRDARILGTKTVDGRAAWIVAFFDPVTPSWFTIAVDRETYRTRWADMIATAHFMHEDYSRFNSPTSIEPPAR